MSTLYYAPAKTLTHHDFSLHSTSSMSIFILVSVLRRDRKIVGGVLLGMMHGKEIKIIRSTPPVSFFVPNESEIRMLSEMWLQ